MLAKKMYQSWNERINRIGYGAMVLEGYYGESQDSIAIKTLRHAIDNGMMLDTADAYGKGHNESLIGRALIGRQSPTFIATKFGVVFDKRIGGTELNTGWGMPIRVNGSPEYIKHALEGSLSRLGVQTIDLWYAHYNDPRVPVEETVGAMAEAVSEGKVRYIGLSNVSADIVKRAHAVHPISAVQFEYSVWRREAEETLLPTLRELGIPLVAWSPLGCGFLTGKVNEICGPDFRQYNPRFSPENLSWNKSCFAPFMQLSDELDLNPAQLALAWLVHQGNDIIPIPGTRSLDRLNENLGSPTINLDSSILSRIDNIAPLGLARGETLI